MKYLTSALVLVALFGAQESNAIRINSKISFTDDLVKSLAEEMSKDNTEEENNGEEEKKAEVKKAAAPAPKPIGQKMAEIKNAPAPNAANATAAAQTQ